MRAEDIPAVRAGLEIGRPFAACIRNNVKVALARQDLVDLLDAVEWLLDERRGQPQAG
jgi:hypothetical protein